MFLVFPEYNHYNSTLLLLQYCYSMFYMHNFLSIYSITGPGPPIQFIGQVISDMDIHLSWKDPLNPNGIVRFYYIRIYDTKTGQQAKNLVNKTAVKQDRPQWHLISNLKPFTNYTFTIQAVTIKPGKMANVTAMTEQGGIFFSQFCQFYQA